MADSQFPESYRDERYAALDAATEQKLELPPGLLASVRTNGERSNHSQTNEKGTATVYQFTPSTRKAILDKYGLDVTLSPENASEGAGLLLQEGLKRNGGDPAQAVGEYIGGIDRANWGKTTKSYINRVMVGLQKTSPIAAPATAPAGQSTFDRVQASMQPAVPPDAIARVYAAYQAGQLSPEERAEFEADVKAGKVMLPKGASLQQESQPAGDVLPQGVLDAYYDGKMTPEEKAQLQADVKNGLAKLPPGVQLEAGGTLAGSARASQIPGQEGEPVIQPATPEPSLGEKAIGAGEAALSTATGMTSGTAGMVAGTVGGLAGAVLNGEFGTPEGAQRVEQAAAEGAQALTYAPRTRSGQNQAEAVGNAVAQTIPAAAVLPTIPVTVKPALRAAQRPLTAAQESLKAKVEAAAARRAEAANDPNAAGAATGNFGADSVGAARITEPQLRRQAAQDLPAPIDLTKGQAERTFEQQRFEGEMAKDPIKGQALRDRAAEQHAQVWRNFDLWADETGAQKTQLGEIGDAVQKALMERAQADKNRIRAEYKAAEKAGEMEQPVVLEGAVKYLNENAPDAAVAKVLDAARARAVRLGVALEGTDGELIPQPVPLKTAELFRRAVSNATDYEPTNIRHSAEIRGLVDQATDGLGGDMYRSARALRARYAQNYENIGLIYDLMNTKRGMSDARVAAERVFDRSILQGTMQEVKQLRRILQTGGENGQQAWRELQGATLRYIREQASRNVARNERGQEMVSVKGLDTAINGLDKSGKLDFVFGRRGAEQLRALNDLSKVLFTAPPGAINTSNTASVILAALDIATSGIAGMPLPIASGLRILTTHVRDRQIQKRINEALGIKPAPKKVKAPVSVVPKASPNPSRVPESRTVH